MIVAMLSAEYPPRPGGIGDYTRRLGQSLVERGQHVFVLTIDDLQFTIVDLHQQDANHKSKIVNPKSNWGWRMGRDVRAALQQMRPDILHIQYQTGAYGMHPAINFLPWRLRRTQHQPAVVVTAHDLLPPYLFPKAGSLRQWVTRRLLADADAVVVTNQDDYERVRDWGLGIGDRGSITPAQPPTPNSQLLALIPIGSNIAVAPPAHYDRAAWRARLGIAADQTLLAYFGLISLSKGLDTLLDALARLPARFRLVVIGGAATAPEDRAYADAIRQQIVRLGLDQRVTITGHCTEADVSAHLLAADIAALPFAHGASFRRGSLLAALAHGLAVVTTGPTTDLWPKGRPPLRAGDRRPTTDDRESSASVHRPSSFVFRPLTNGENVLLAPPGDALALVAAIERLARDTGLREQLAAGGRALAAQFGWDAIAAQHEQLYERLIEKKL
jgi:glycosyltransferase involved in cell wall biosynthesis